MKCFKTPSEAEGHYFHQSASPVQPQPTAKVNVEVQTDLTVPPTQSSVEYLGSDTSVPSPNPSDENLLVTMAAQTDPVAVAHVVGEMLSQLSEGYQLEFMSKFFSQYALVNHCLTVPEDFLILSAKAMAQLKHSDRSNVLYNLAMGLGTLRDDGSDSRFPTRRMPMGLVEHMANFFVAEEMRKVSE